MERLKQGDRLLGPVARQIGRLLHALPSWGKAQEPHGVILRPGGMGDLICAQMALEALGLDPRLPLWLINERSRNWAEVQGLRFSCLENKLILLVLRFRKSLELVINTEQYFGLAHALALALARKAPVAFASNGGVGPETVTVAYDPEEEHEVSSHFRLFQRAYRLPPPSALLPRQQSIRTAERIVCLAGRQSPSRALPGSTWKQLIKGWAGTGPILLAGAPIDQSFTQELAERLGAPVFNGTFPELVKRIAQAEEILTLDGGMVHVASYYGVKTTAIFTSGRDKKWAPLAAGSRLIRRNDLACQPCTLYGQVPPCPHAYACQKLAWPESLLPIL